MPRKQNRNAQGGGSIRKRSDTLWEARYTAGRDPGTGKQIQKSVYGKSQAEVRKKLQAICVALDEDEHIEPSKHTVKTWCETWLRDYTFNLKPLTLKSYREHINKHIVPALGALKLSAVNTDQIQALYNKLQKTGLSPKTIKNTHGVLHKALQQAVGNKYIKYNPSDACILPRYERAEIKPLDDENLIQFLEAIKGDEYGTLYFVDVFTGMRQGELLGLTWDCIDFTKGTLRIYRQLQRIDGEHILVSLKNDKSRIISPAGTVMNVLKEQKKIQTAWKLRAGSAWQNKRNMVFTDQLGQSLCYVTVYKHFKRIMKDMGLPDMRLHDLRHTYAVLAIQSGDDIKTVQETLGHHTASFTLDIYGHVTERMKRESAERMEAYIKEISQIK